MKIPGKFFSAADGLSHSVFYFIFFLACFALYFKCLQNGYALDDDYILNDKSVQKGIGGAGEIFGSRYISYYHTNYEYRPLAKLLFAAEYELFGLKPAGAHFVNLSLYFLVSVLLFRLLLLLKFIPGKTFAGLSVLLFILHPLHTEVVCSIKNLDILLSAVFSLSAAICLLNFLEKGKKILPVAMVLFLLAGLLSKLDTLPFFGILPALVLLQDSRRLKLATGCFISFIILYILFIKTRKFILSDEEDLVLRKMYFHENPLGTVNDIKLKLLAVFSSFGFYIEKLIAGFPMVCYYGFDTVSVTAPFSQRYFYAGATAILLMIFFVWKKRKDRLFLFCMLMLFAPLSMYLNFPKPAPGIIADRFTFLSAFGFALLLAYLVYSAASHESFRAAKKFIFIPIILIMLVYSGLTASRIPDWKDHLTLAESDVKKVPRSAMMHFLKGSFTLSAAKQKSGTEKKSLLDSALNSFRKSLEIFPGNPSAWNYIGGIYFYQFRDFENSYPYFKKAYSLDAHSDNRTLYAKSAFLSGRKDEFYSFAKAQIDSGKGKEIIEFIHEFPEFLGTDSLKKAYRDLGTSGIRDPGLLKQLGTALVALSDKEEGMELLFLSFKNGYRDKKLAEELAEFFYESSQVAKASFLMDIAEGKVK